MSTTRLMPLHTGKGKTVAAALGRTINYIKNPDKTNGGDLVTTYKCDPLSINAEFLLTKDAIIERISGKRIVIPKQKSTVPVELQKGDAQASSFAGFGAAAPTSKMVWVYTQALLVWIPPGACPMLTLSFPLYYIILNM